MIKPLSAPRFPRTAIDIPNWGEALVNAFPPLVFLKKLAVVVIFGVVFGD